MDIYSVRFFFLLLFSDDLKYQSVVIEAIAISHVIVGAHMDIFFVRFFFFSYDLKYQCCCFFGLHQTLFVVMINELLLARSNTRLVQDE